MLLACIGRKTLACRQSYFASASVLVQSDALRATIRVPFDVGIHVWDAPATFSVHLAEWIFWFASRWSLVGALAQCRGSHSAWHSNGDCSTRGVAWENVEAVSTRGVFAICSCPSSRQGNCEACLGIIATQIARALSIWRLALRWTTSGPDCFEGTCQHAGRGPSVRRKIVGVHWKMVKVHVSLAPEIHENQSYAPYIRYNVRPSGCLGNQRPTGRCPPISSSSCEAFVVYVALCGGLRSEPNATGEFGHLEYGKYIYQSALRRRWYERHEGDLVLHHCSRPSRACNPEVSGLRFKFVYWYGIGSWEGCFRDPKELGILVCGTHWSPSRRIFILDRSRSPCRIGDWWWPASWTPRRQGCEWVGETSQRTGAFWRLWKDMRRIWQEGSQRKTSLQNRMRQMSAMKASRRLRHPPEGLCLQVRSDVLGRTLPRLRRISSMLQDSENPWEIKDG